MLLHYWFFVVVSLPKEPKTRWLVKERREAAFVTGRERKADSIQVVGY